MSKLLVILGPTASGKSALGLKLAQKFNGEIINADSRSVYRYMDIGTAKPTHDEMLLIPHHLIDIRNPNEPYSASQFKSDALIAINDISGRGKLPIVVGGTGLYIDSLLFDYQFPGLSNQDQAQIRFEIARLSHEQLLERLLEVDPEAFTSIDLHNPRRVMRAIETAGMSRSRTPAMRAETLVIGLSLSKEIIQNKIQHRIEKMLERGLISEAKQLGENFGWDNEAMTGPAYKAFKNVVLGTKSLAEGVRDFAKADIALAKRQMTWFKRNPDICWLDAQDPLELYRTAKKLTKTFLIPDQRPGLDNETAAPHPH